MRWDEAFTLDAEEYAQQVAEHRVPCEYCLRRGEGLIDGDYCGMMPARWFLLPPADQLLDILHNSDQLATGLWVCAEHYDLLVEQGWHE